MADSECEKATVPVTSPERRSGRAIAIPKVPHRIQSLFHDVDGKAHYSKTKLSPLHSADPNVFFVKNFLNVSELNYLDTICTKYAANFTASFTESGSNQEVVSQERTSLHIHLSKSQDHFVRSIEQRAADLVGLSPTNVEPLQIVSYKNGQKFNLHHDAGTLLEDGNVELVQPRRLVTFFVYLNSLPEGQGHTEFPLLGLSVRPERGCAVLWSNVLPNGEADKRTVHKANPVAQGLLKFGLNIWLCDTDLQELVAAAPTYKATPDEISKTVALRNSNTCSSIDRNDNDRTDRSSSNVSETHNHGHSTDSSPSGRRQHNGNNKKKKKETKETSAFGTADILVAKYNAIEAGAGGDDNRGDDDDDNDDKKEGEQEEEMLMLNVERKKNKYGVPPPRPFQSTTQQKSSSSSSSSSSSGDGNSSTSSSSSNNYYCGGSNGNSCSSSASLIINSNRSTGSSSSGTERNWSIEENDYLMRAVMIHGKEWTTVAKVLKSQQKENGRDCDKTAASCRLQWDRKFSSELDETVVHTNGSGSGPKLNSKRESNSSSSYSKKRTLGCWYDDDYY